MDGWIKLSENGGRVVKYVNRRNIVSVNDVGGGVITTMWNGDTVRMKELPPDEPKLPYDAEVEYLESTGTQYIDTGIVPNTAGTVSVDVQINPSTATAQALFAARSRNSVSAGAFAAFRLTDTLRFDVRKNGQSGLVITDVPPLGERHTFTAEANRFYIDGDLRGEAPPLVFDAEGPLLLLAATSTTSTGFVNFLNGRIYAATYRDPQGNLVRDFIPVRVSSLGYLYDRANPTGGPLGNGLYGDFSDGKGGVTGFPANLVGPDKPKP